MKNLFDYATKELSQDAFLRWLFENYNCEKETVRLTCKSLFDAFTDNELDFSKVESLNTLAQWKNIDVSLWFKCDKKDYLIVIEDKTTSEEHDQLENYNKKIEEHCNWLVKTGKNPIEKVYKVFYKTAEISLNEEERIKNAGWNKILTIKEIYKLFQDVVCTQSEILDGYAKHIGEIYNSYYNFKELPFNKWLYNNTVFLAYSQKELKVDYTGCYNGIYVYASKQTKFAKFTTEILFEFRHWEITAKIQYWKNQGQTFELNKLTKYLRQLNLSDISHFLPNTYYGDKRLAKITKNAQNTNKEFIFEDYKEFNAWVISCIESYEKFTKKVNEGDFENYIL